MIGAVLQEAFVRCMGKVRVDDKGSVIGWFYRTLKNAAVDYHRRHQTASKAGDAFAAETDDKADSDLELRNAVCQCVGGLAETLKPAYGRR